jgi:3-deoxy-D-manno-octulosonic-acid transferase
MLDLIYSGVAQGARLVAAVAPAREGKLWRALRARRGIRARYTKWGREGRDPARALLWMHAPSVGEGLQARPVLQRLRTAHPELQLAYTHFSPSAERFARALDVDFTDYLPFDTAGDARTALDALRPSALVFSKLDVWPTLAREAARRGVRLGMISATLAEGSGRRNGIAATLLRAAYARLDAVGAIDEDDAARLVELGVRPGAISVTGDTRYDQVWARAEGVDRASTLLAPLASPRPTLVAGSTWPSDESVLLDAWIAVRRRVPGARLIIAPHEPVATHLAPIERWAAEQRIPLARLDAPDAGAADVVLVDRVGVLGDLYALATVAYVGGGFHAAGLHSVLEPAAFGAPVLFGPRSQASRDARLLQSAGGGARVASSPELAERLTHWLSSAPTRTEAGVRARTLVHDGLGAAERSVRLVEGLLEGVSQEARARIQAGPPTSRSRP